MLNSRTTTQGFIDCLVFSEKSLPCVTGLILYTGMMAIHVTHSLRNINKHFYICIKMFSDFWDESNPKYCFLLRVYLNKNPKTKK